MSGSDTSTRKVSIRYVIIISLTEEMIRLIPVVRNEPFEFGCTQLLVPPATVRKLVKQDLINISPAGAVFVKPEVRTGIIPQMLSEILNTRIMVRINY